MGTKTDGNILIMGGCGPMGLGAVSYGIQFENKPKRIVVTDVNEDRINPVSYTHLELIKELSGR